MVDPEIYTLITIARTNKARIKQVKADEKAAKQREAVENRKRADEAKIAKQQARLEKQANQSTRATKRQGLTPQTTNQGLREVEESTSESENGEFIPIDELERLHEAQFRQKFQATVDPIRPIRVRRLPSRFAH